MSSQFARARRLVQAAVAIVAVNACADSSTNVTAPELEVALPRAVLVTPTPAQVMVQGTDLGAFTAPIVADNSYRTTTEFWDNLSTDTNAENRNCNVGHYALGSMSAGCKFELAGSYANRGGGYTKYWGDSIGGRDASSFKFNGAYSYTVTLKGSYTGIPSAEVGYFTVSNGVYTFTKVDAWTNREIGTSVVVNTGGANWGFYFTNSFNEDVTGCTQVGTHCSDATNGFAPGAGRQHWSLMINDAGDKYLVGMEDNTLTIYDGITDEGVDSDYNDYMFSLVPNQIDIPSGGQGCSPGYWKNPKRAWPAPYARSTTFASAFAGGNGSNVFGATQTLEQTINTGGGKQIALARHAVSALLNAASTKVDYELTTAQVIEKFNSAFDANGKYIPSIGDPLIAELAALEDVDGRVCPNPGG